MLELRNVRLRRGAAVLFDRANLTIFRGDKIGVVGRNGCGKSSLLALLRGELAPDTGDYSLPGKLNFVSVSQELPRTEATVLEYVRSGDKRLMEIEAELEKARAAEDGMQEAHLLGDYELAGGYTSAARAAELGCWGVIGDTPPRLAPDDSLFELIAQRCELSALKPAETGTGLVVRILNPSDDAETVTLRFGIPIAGAELVRLDESALGQSLVVSGNELAIEVPPHALRTVLCDPAY